MLKIKSALSFAVVMSIVAYSHSTPESEQLRTTTRGYIQQNNETEGIVKITRLLGDKLKYSIRPGASRLAMYGVGADCVRLMNLTKKAPLSEEALRWILASDQRLHVLVDTVEPKDKLKECFKIISQLAAYDPVGRDKYYELIIALSVVWDVPNRSLLHGQMGKDRLAYSAQMNERYDYFKNLYDKGGSKIDYSKLSTHELVFVVDTPVPLEELQWVRDNVGGSIGTWDRKFQEIIYDQGRLERGEYSWMRGPYALASIQQYGGICVDQAYYCVMTARAYGIPSIYFHAIGKSGGHAWFSYMRDVGKWVLDVGRYENQNYTTGDSINPQTNETLTDHDVQFACERSGKSPGQVQAGLYMALADVLRKADPAASLRCAAEARRLFNRDLRAWDIEMDVLLALKDFAGLLKLFDEQKDVFRKYPDILAASARKIEALLLAVGRDSDAATLMRSLSGAVGDDRDDISRSIELARINQIQSSGDPKKALREFKQLLEKQIEEGSKVIPLMQQFVDFAKKTGQEEDAARFLKEYVAALVQKEDYTQVYEQQFYQILAQACKNAGDASGEEEARATCNLLKQSS